MKATMTCYVIKERLFVDVKDAAAALQEEGYDEAAKRLRSMDTAENIERIKRVK